MSHNADQRFEASRQYSSESQGYDAHNMTRDTPDQRQNTLIAVSSDGHTTPRKHAPSPLQVSETFLSETGNTGKSLHSPTVVRTTRTASDSPYSSRSPRSNLKAGSDQPKSPKERLVDFFASGATSTTGATGTQEGGFLGNTVVSPPKTQSFSQLRKTSSPLPLQTTLGNSSPPSPRSTASPVPFGAIKRPEMRQMPRTSSIDSAISTLSLGTQHSNNPSQDAVGSGSTDIANLINIAGSAETLIQHLLKKEQHSAAQAARLWKVVENQRALLHGLNEDLDRAIKDKERYRRRLTKRFNTIRPLPNTVKERSTSQPRIANDSPAPSEASADLPIQRQSLERATMNGPDESGPVPLSFEDHSSDNSEAPSVDTKVDSEEAEEWVRNRTRTKGVNHSHKATSSSDIGIFGPSTTMLPVNPIQTNVSDAPTSRILLERISQSSQDAAPATSPISSFTAKRSQPFATFHSPPLTLNESASPRSEFENITPPRKPPPAPLDLNPTRRDDRRPQPIGPDDHSESEYDDNMEVDELPALHRGRKKTREEDDKEREVALLQGHQDQSQSNKSSKRPPQTFEPPSNESDDNLLPQKVSIASSIKAFSPDSAPAGSSTLLSPPISLVSVLSQSDGRHEPSTTERTIPMKPISPGLPLSPRPIDRPMNPPTPRMPRNGAVVSVTSPSLSRGNGLVGLPLSPRAPRQPIPPPFTPMSLVSPRLDGVESRNDTKRLFQEPRSPIEKPTSTFQAQQSQASEAHDSQSEETTSSKGVFRGLVSENYPDLLIPPNALPSIMVKVVSSRLKPSRHSLVIKGADEEPVFTLGVSARSHRQELWQVEKAISSLQQLDQQLRQSSAFNVKLPDRSLFSGHAPAKVDARRVALEKYFEILLDTQLDEKAALELCRYLSRQVSEPSSNEINGAAQAPEFNSSVLQGPDGRFLKEGYLTKRGKNFGGWKARFFALNEPVLRYYETSGGSLLGTIKLQGAQIGKQAQSKSYHSPSQEAIEGDGQYRHAFLIREPKRKDSNTFVDHVLCAESDAERDAWVAALLCYVESPANDGSSRPPLFNNDTGSGRASLAPANKSSTRYDAIVVDSPDSPTFDSLQAVPYEDTMQAQAPHVLITPDPRPIESPSPTTSGSQPSSRNQLSQSKPISAPSNGAKISDVGAWGNKPMSVPVTNQKDHKKRSIWSFRDKNAADLGVHQSNGSNLNLTQQQYQEQITNVKAAFGAPLAEAVEYCSPNGIDVCLPAVVHRCLEYLEAKDARNEEGIFRMSGSNTVIKKLRSRFNAEGDFDLLTDEQYYDVHAVASLLKLYLRELPTNLLTRELHLDFISVLDLDDKPKKMTAYNVLVHKLPKPNFTLLRALSAFLTSVVTNSENNKMGIRNISIVFSPTLNIPNPVFSMFLTEFDSIFGAVVEDVPTAQLEMRAGKALTPEDIRSPRRQIFSDIPTPSYNQDSFSAKAGEMPPSYVQSFNDSRLDNDTGFIPLQPAYEHTAPQSQLDSYSLSGPEYGVARPRNLVTGGAAKARRRESSMLSMGMGERKSSLPSMRSDAGTLSGETTFR